jgi:hypothetical protein
MTLADITLVAFTLCNSFRVLAYLPQIATAARDRSGAQAISFATWGLFLLSNVSAVAYALVNKDDWTMAAVFLANGAGCTTILVIGVWKRYQYRRRHVPAAPVVRASLGIAAAPTSRATLAFAPGLRPAAVTAVTASRRRRSHTRYRRS